MKFLIIRFSSIGDIVLTTPVIRCLKLQLKDVEIHYLTKENYKGIIETNPYIDKVHILDDDFINLITNLKAVQFDYVIDLHYNLRSLRVKKALKHVKTFSFNKLNIEKWLMTAFKINRLPKVHIVDRYMQTIEFSGVSNDGKGLDYFIPEKDVVPLTDLPASHLHGFIGLVIGAALNTKKMPVHKLKELCAAINHPIILIGGKEDKKEGEEISKTDSIKIYNGCGKFNLNESADLVRKAKLIISHDTGLMHIATAFNKPIISIWGNTIPAFGMNPYYGNHKIENQQFSIDNLSCRPCSKIGYKKCPRGHFNCMEMHDVKAIAQKAMSILLTGK